MPKFFIIDKTEAYNLGKLHAFLEQLLIGRIVVLECFHTTSCKEVRPVAIHGPQFCLSVSNVTINMDIQPQIHIKT